MITRAELETTGLSCAQIIVCAIDFITQDHSRFGLNRSSGLVPTSLVSGGDQHHPYIVWVVNNLR